MLFPFTNSRVDISAFNIYCGQSSFSITARYPDWVNEIMGEALWREICLIVNKPKRNVKLKSVTGQVHCKREKCCAYEPFTWAPLPNPKIKTSLSKVQALKFILQNAASKVGNCVFPNSNLQILSSKSNLRSSFANLFNFKFSKTCWKSPKLNKGILAHFEKMSLARWFWAFFFFWKKKGCFAS